MGMGMRGARLLVMLRAPAAFAKRLSALVRDFEGFAISMPTVGCVQDLHWNVDWTRVGGIDGKRLKDSLKLEVGYTSVLSIGI